MAYGIIAESGKPLDWPALQKALAPIRRRVELFPVTKDAGGVEGLGLSVPQIKICDESWEEIIQIAEVVQKQFGMAVFDLASGVKFSPETLEKVRKAFLPEE